MLSRYKLLIQRNRWQLPSSIAVNRLNQYSTSNIARSNDEREGIPANRDDVSNKEKTTKKQFALVVGYIGSNYFGCQFQDNPSIPTIERSILDAMLASNCVLKSNISDRSRLAWSRSSRTDKGVHCSFLLISCKIEFNPSWLDDVTANASKDYRSSKYVVDLLNSHLPADIRVFSCCRVNHSFNARTATVWREYEYLLPLNILRNYKSNSDNEIIEKLNSKFLLFRGTHSFHNYHRTPLRDLSATALSKLHKSQNNNRSRDISSEDSQLGQGTSSKVGSEDIDYGDTDFEIDLEDSKSFTSTSKNSDLIAKLQDVYSKFESSSLDEDCNEKNELDKLLPFDIRTINARTYRSIQHFSIKDIVKIDDAKFARVIIRGSSFMLHQIRLMIGASVLEAIGAVPENFINYSLLSPLRVTIPMAPPEGLILTKLGLKTESSKESEPLFSIEYPKAVPLVDSNNAKKKKKKVVENLDKQIYIMGLKEYYNCEEFKVKYIYPKIKEEWTQRKLENFESSAGGSVDKLDRLEMKEVDKRVPKAISSDGSGECEDRISVEELFHVSLGRFGMSQRISKELIPALYEECVLINANRIKQKTEMHNKLIDESISLCHSQDINNLHLYVTYNNSNNSNSNSDLKSKKVKGGPLLKSHTIIPARNLLPYGFYNFVVEKIEQYQYSPHLIKASLVKLAIKIAKGEVPKHLSCEDLWAEVNRMPGGFEGLQY